MKSEAALAELMGRMRSLEADHTPDGWPAVKMRDITALCDAIVARSEIGALDLVSRIREALGDNGTRMQDDLLEYCRELRDSAGALAALGDEYDALKGRETALNLEIISLHAAITAYGQHTAECASHTSRGGKWLECDCGWDDSEFNPDNVTT